MKRQVIRITIGVRFANRFQQKALVGALASMLEAWRAFTVNAHKENAVTIQSEGLL